MKYISTLFLIVIYLGNLFSQFVDTTNHLQTFEKISSGFLINTGFLKTTKDLIINEERSNERHNLGQIPADRIQTSLDLFRKQQLKKAILKLRGGLV